MTLHRKKPKMARSWWRLALNSRRYPAFYGLWFACYRWHKAVKS